MVLMPELRLIELSIVRQGWVQPILINPEGEIIDGFHRWRLSIESKELQRRYEGFVPCAVIDVSRAEAMMLTVRINRAKGTHAAVRMHELVRTLIDELACDEQEVAKGIGASIDEVRVLYQEDIFQAKGIANYRYSDAWVPTHRLGSRPAPEQENANV